MGVKVLGVAPANGSSAGGGLFGHGSDPELAPTTEVSGPKVLLLVPSVTAGATGASDPVRSSLSGLRCQRWRHAFSILLGTSPERSGQPGAWRGLGGGIVAATDAPCVFKQLFGLHTPETKLRLFTI